MRKIEKRRQAESEKGNGDDDPKAETKKPKTKSSQERGEWRRREIIGDVFQAVT